MAEFGKYNRNNRKKENKINFCNNKLNKAIICSNYNPKYNSKPTTMKRKMDSTSLKLQSGRESFEKGDLERPSNSSKL